jgi:hypothetical protein
MGHIGRQTWIKNKTPFTHNNCCYYLSLGFIHIRNRSDCNRHRILFFRFRDVLFQLSNCVLRQKFPSSQICTSQTNHSRKHPAYTGTHHYYRLTSSRPSLRPLLKVGEFTLVLSKLWSSNWSFLHTIEFIFVLPTNLTRTCLLQHIPVLEKSMHPAACHTLLLTYISQSNAFAAEKPNQFSYSNCDILAIHSIAIFLLLLLRRAGR